MLKHFWKTAVRNLIRNKLFTAINLIGLSVSLAVFLALWGYSTYQLSFDKFYQDVDRVYRINYFEYEEGIPILQSARTHDRAALLASEYVPAIEAVARVYNEKAYVFTEDIRIVDQDMVFADSSFFKVFPVKLIDGSADKGLEPPDAVMISKSQAEVYFGKENPMGKTIYFNERLAFTITGVFEDIPATSSIDFDFLLSWSTLAYHGWVARDGDFKAPWTFTFVKLREGAPPVSTINDQLSKMAHDHITTLEKRNHTARYELRPYRDLHVSPDLSGEVKPGINRTLLYVLMSLGIFILVTAWINYINLSLARSIERADEIGVRKVFGAGRLAVSGHFLIEALILSCMSYALGWGLFKLITGPLSNVVLAGNIGFIEGYRIHILFLIAFITATALIAFYPAYFISRFKPVLILKNKLAQGRGKTALLHQGLMAFQLFLAIAVVAITLIASRQVAYAREFDSGFNTHQTISLRAPASTNSDSLRYSRFVSFRNEVLRNHQFRSGTASMNIPGQEIRFHDEGIHATGAGSEKKQSFWVMWVDEGYTETFGLTLSAGRNFREREFDPVCLINETAAKALGYDSPSRALNTTVITSDYPGPVTVIGIIKDYHHESIRKAVDPIIFYYHHPHEYGYYSFQAQSREGHFVQDLEKIWKSHYPNDQFIFYFMDRFYLDQYQADELFGKLLSLFSVISITVSSLGLFGMATLAIVKRTKEIGVRKVLGATAWNILVLLSSGYIRLTAIACVFALPVAYYFMDRWLQGFAYKISIEWWMIALPALLVLFAAVATIAGQSVRAAWANPVKSLKEE